MIGKAYVRDVVINGGKPEKLWHTWQQPLATAKHFIGALTSAGGTVADFMAGAGTTIVAARALGRKWTWLVILARCLARANRCTSRFSVWPIARNFVSRPES